MSASAPSGVRTSGRERAIKRQTHNELLARSVHEIRSAALAMDAILQMIEGRAAETSAPEQRDLLFKEIHVLRRSARRLDRLAAAMRPLLNRGAPDRRAESDLGAIVARAAADLDVDCAPRRIRLEVPRARVMVRSHPDILSATVLIVLASAVHAADEGAFLSVEFVSTHAGVRLELAGTGSPRPTDLEYVLGAALAGLIGGTLEWEGDSSGPVLELDRDSDAPSGEEA